MKKLIKSAA